MFLQFAFNNKGNKLYRTGKWGKWEKWGKQRPKPYAEGGADEGITRRKGRGRKKENLKGFSHCDTLSCSNQLKTDL